MVPSAGPETKSEVGTSLPLEKLQACFSRLMPEAQELLTDIAERLVVGQERYGGFKFGEYDLDQMSVEEIEDFIVYIVAKYRKKI